MGVAISLFNSLFGKKKVRILMAGLDAAGKTTILYKLILGEVVNTIPTIANNLETVQYKNISMTIWDIGGGYKIRHVWQYHFTNIDGIIYVVDSNDRERVDEAADELHNIVLKGEEVKDCVLLVFANKQDLPNSMTTDELADKLKLNTLKERNWYIQAVCATQGDGLYEGFDWLSNELSNK